MPVVPSCYVAQQFLLDERFEIAGDLGVAQLRLVHDLRLSGVSVGCCLQYLCDDVMAVSAAVPRTHARGLLSLLH